MASVHCYGVTCRWPDGLDTFSELFLGIKNLTGMEGLVKADKEITESDYTHSGTVSHIQPRVESCQQGKLKRPFLSTFSKVEFKSSKCPIPFIYRI